MFFSSSTPFSIEQTVHPTYFKNESDNTKPKLSFIHYLVLQRMSGDFSTLLCQKVVGN